MRWIILDDFQQGGAKKHEKFSWIARTFADGEKGIFFGGAKDFLQGNGFFHGIVCDRIDEIGGASGFCRLADACCVMLS